MNNLFDDINSTKRSNSLYLDFKALYNPFVPKETVIGVQAGVSWNF